MNVIDKILKEWSFRCHDGIVDLNDPNKVKILEEMISNNELIDLFNSIPDEDKERIVKKLKNFSKGTNKELIIKLNQKNLDKISKNIIELAEEHSQEDELLECLKSGIDFSSLSSSGNLIDKFKEKGIKENFSIELNKLTYDGVGKGEIALIILLNNAKKSESKGDIEINGQTIEIKSKRSKMVIRSLGIKSVEDINKLIDELIDNLFENNDKKISIKEKIASIKGWPNKLNFIYTNYSDKNKFEKELQDFLKELYGNKFNAKLDISNVDKFKIDIAKELAKEYTNKTKYDNIIFIDGKANYKIFPKENIEDSIEKEEIKIAEFSDSVPRLEYNISQSIQEEPTLEEILFSLRAK